MVIPHSNLTSMVPLNLGSEHTPHPAIPEERRLLAMLIAFARADAVFALIAEWWAWGRAFHGWVKSRRDSIKHFFKPTIALFALAAAGAAQADNHSDKTDWKAQSPEVVERTADGKATKVRVGDKVYDVCENEKQDSCIQPRAAGLNRGDYPLNYWPGPEA